MPNGMSTMSNLCNIISDMNGNWHNVVNKLSTNLVDMGVHDLQLSMLVHKSVYLSILFVTYEP